MFRYMLNGGGDIKSYLIGILLSLPIVLLSLSLHETAHGFAAWKLGDPTAHNLGRLTLNPVKHLDPIGFICMLVAGFGWAKPVPINSRYFKNPKRDTALVGLAGPLSNLLLAFLFVLILRFGYLPLYIKIQPNSEFSANVIYWFYVFLYYGVYMNLTLAVFNLLPVPPLDGSRIFYVFLPPRLYFKVMKYEQYISIAIMLLLILGPLSDLISLVTNLLMNGMFRLVGLG